MPHPQQRASRSELNLSCLTPISISSEEIRTGSTAFRLNSGDVRKRTSSNTTSASEPTSPTSSHPPQRRPNELNIENDYFRNSSGLRIQHKANSSTSLHNHRSTTYFVPSPVTTPGPSNPPKYTSQSEGEGDETEAREEDDYFIWNRRPLAQSYQSKVLRKSIRTGHGTETEDPDDPTSNRPLPNARFPVVSDTPALQPIIVQLLRLLSIVPAVLGSLYHTYFLIVAQRRPIDVTVIDNLTCLIFALLTALQHLALTTGLLLRWRTFYTPAAVLIRLLALQSICWPATHLTVRILDHSSRPVVCWAVIGTTTCVSRSIQMWVCSNLYVVRAPTVGPAAQRTLWPDWSWAWREPRVTLERRKRRWDWERILWRCGVPLGICYFFMAWGEVLKREIYRV